MNNLKKEATPDKEWKTSLRADLLSGMEAEPVFLQTLDRAFSFSAVAVAGLLLAFVFNYSIVDGPEELEMAENRINEEVVEFASVMRDEDTDLTTLVKETEEGESVLAGANMEDIDEKDRLEVVERSIENVSEEVEELERRLASIMGGS